MTRTYKHVCMLLSVYMQNVHVVAHTECVCVCDITAMHRIIVTIIQGQLYINASTEEAKGKGLAERSALMAQKWRSMTESEKEVYRKQADDIKDNPLETMSPKDKRDLVLKIAKRHQADVSPAL